MLHLRHPIRCISHTSHRSRSLRRYFLWRLSLRMADATIGLVARTARHGQHAVGVPYCHSDRLSVLVPGRKACPRACPRWAFSFLISRGHNVSHALEEFPFPEARELAAILNFSRQQLNCMAI